MPVVLEEFWLDGQTHEEAAGYKKFLSNPYVATVISVVLGIGLGMTGYANIWALFGAANQLLAAIGLLAVASWLGKVGKNNKMFLLPMAFMLIVTITSLCFTIKTNIAGAMAGGDGVAWCWIRGIIAILLVVLAVILAIEGINSLIKQHREKKAAA